MSASFRRGDVGEASFVFNSDLTQAHIDTAKTHGRSSLWTERLVQIGAGTTVLAADV